MHVQSGLSELHLEEQMMSLLAEWRTIRTKFSRQRLYAFLLILGATILLVRISILLVGDAFGIFVIWVFCLLLLELLTDLLCLLASIRWWISKDMAKSRAPLRLAAGVVVIHAIRVLVFVLGRIGPWIDFDVRPEQRALHDARWSWEGVYFAAAMSFI
ncbi:MAG: hypothetical protein OEQ53_11910, partial [Saprospiraceae bacterium]|nr:hypothetical protein [Saprospiraceae bacterium]